MESDRFLPDITHGATSGTSGELTKPLKHNTNRQAASDQRSRLLELPPELRLTIYAMAFSAVSPYPPSDAELKARSWPGIITPALLHVCRPIRCEAYNIRLRESTIYIDYRSSASRDAARAWLRSLHVKQSMMIKYLRIPSPRDGTFAAKGLLHQQWTFLHPVWDGVDRRVDPGSLWVQAKGRDGELYLWSWPETEHNDELRRIKIGDASWSSEVVPVEEVDRGSTSTAF